MRAGELPGEPEQKRVRQRLAHLPAEIAFLRTMRLVNHCDDVAAVVQNAAGFGKLEDGGDDDLPRVLRQQALQLGPAVGFHEIRRVGSVEGARDLRVEVHAIDDDHDGGILQCRMQPQLPGGKQRFDGRQTQCLLPQLACHSVSSTLIRIRSRNYGQH